MAARVRVNDEPSPENVRPMPASPKQTPAHQESPSTSHASVVSDLPVEQEDADQHALTDLRDSTDGLLAFAAQLVAEVSERGEQAAHLGSLRNNLEASMERLRQSCDECQRDPKSEEAISAFESESAEFQSVYTKLDSAWQKFQSDSDSQAPAEERETKGEKPDGDGPGSNDLQSKEEGQYRGGMKFRYTRLPRTAQTPGLVKHLEFRVPQPTIHRDPREPLAPAHQPRMAVLDVHSAPKHSSPQHRAATTVGGSGVPDGKPTPPSDRQGSAKAFLGRRAQAGERLSQIDPPAPSRTFAVKLHERAQKYFGDLPSALGKEQPVYARVRNDKDLKMVEVLIDTLAAAQADDELVASLDPDFQAAAQQALQEAREKLENVLDHTPDPVAAGQAALYIRNTSAVLRQIYQDGALRMRAPSQGGHLDRGVSLTRQGLGTDAVHLDSQLAKLQTSRSPTVKAGAELLKARLTALKPKLFGDVAPTSLLDRAKEKQSQYVADAKGAALSRETLESLKEFDFVSQCVAHLLAADHAGSGQAVLTHSPLADTKAPSIQPLPASAQLRALDTRNTRALKAHVMQLHQKSAERPEWQSTLAPSVARLSGLIPKLEKMDDVLRLWRLKVLLTPEAERTAALVRLQDAIGALDTACVAWINSAIDGTDESREFQLTNSRMALAWGAVQEAVRPLT